MVARTVAFVIVRRVLRLVGLGPQPGDQVAAGLPDSAWPRRSAGAGSKGPPRVYDWAWLDQVTTDADPDDGGQHSLLIRNNITTGMLTIYRYWTPQPSRLAQLVRVAGIRWTVEEPFQAAKRQVGLDQHQVRRWHSWHRFTTLAVAALAVQAICAADAATSDTTARCLPAGRAADGQGQLAAANDLRDI